MKEPYRIVPAEERAQIDHVRTLLREYAASLGFSLCFQSFDAELAGLPGEYSPPEGQLLLGLCNSTPAGCVALRKLEDGICEMKRLYIRPEFRGRGLGRDLVLALIEQARQSMHGKMRLDTVAASMAEAVGLYRSMGFRDIPPYCHNPIPGAIYLELDLRQPCCGVRDT
jgi:ribosomal protein S18 acetylase RimI-like enzyme